MKGKISNFENNIEKGKTIKKKLSYKYTKNIKTKIRKIIKKRSEGWNVEFKFVDEINRTKGGKYKFIINEIEEVNF